VIIATDEAGADRLGGGSREQAPVPNPDLVKARTLCQLMLGRLAVLFDLLGRRRPRRGRRGCCSSRQLS
jgi:hypothetical protein